MLDAKCLWAFAALMALSLPTVAQFKPPPVMQVRIVNMTPQEHSEEMHRDGEPNLAVNPANPQQMAASALTPDLWGEGLYAPIYVSIDGGQTWRLNTIVPFNNPDTGTGDMTLRFGTLSNVLYAGALRKGEPTPYFLRILRTADFNGPGLMEVLQERGQADQPWVQAFSLRTGATSVDRVFVGYNQTPFAPPGPATIDRSLDAATTPHAPFAQELLNVRGNCGRDGPARPAVHSGGTIYAAFFRFTACPYPLPALWTADVVVVRDANWGVGPNAFRALTEPPMPAGDGNAGVRVVRGVTIPYSMLLGNQRLGSQLSIAVHPSDSQKIYLAWGDGTATNYNLHLRRSSDGGATWTADLRTVTGATNPSLAVNSWGKVAFLYQKLVGTPPSQKWETWVERSYDGFDTPPIAMLLHSAQDVGGSTGAGPLGDYNDMMAVGKNFYGVFSGNNTPDPANFPQGVKYQRKADFTAKTLLTEDGTSTVLPSMDPFFFAIQEPILDLCRFRPWFCNFVPKLEAAGIRLQCLIGGCIIVDPIPRNCLVKFKCPGCPPGGMCPPYYHIHLDGLRDAWDVSLLDSEGHPVDHEFVRTRSGAVLSFRPTMEKFIDGSIGNYLLAFEMRPQGKVGTEYRVKTRLTVSDRHYAPKPVAGKSR